MPEEATQANGLGSRLVSVVAAANKIETKDYPLADVIEWIRSGSGKFGSIVREIRECGSGVRADELKRQLPAAMFSGTFSQRSSKKLTVHSGLLCLDYDDILMPNEKVDEMRFDPHIAAAFVSPSGKGVKVVVVVPAGAKTHARAFLSGRDYIQAAYGLEADESGKDVSRLCFFSCDPNIHYSEDAIELPLLPEETTQTKTPAKTGCQRSDRLGDKYQQAPDITGRSSELLRSLGWQLGRDGGEHTYCTRPGKERGVSGILRKDGSFYCFSSNAQPLDASANYSAFALLAEINHGGDFKAAAQSLVDEFGDSEPTSKGKDFYGKAGDATEPEANDGPSEAAKKLPRWTAADEIPNDLSKQIMQRYPVLIEGMLHRGTKMVLGGGSKSYKTWTLLNLAASVASGTPWFGHDCIQTGRDVIYLNFEVPHEFFLERVKQVCAAMGIEPPPQLKVWSLRGVCNDLRVVLEALQERMDDEGRLALICIDPIYKALGDRDENSAGDMGLLMSEVEALVERTGAAAAFGAHYSKGNQSEKDPLDRVSGSGVFARDPDTILGLTAHEEEDCYTVDVSLRNMPRVDPFVVQWEFPLFKRMEELNPSHLKKPGQKMSKRDALDILGGHVEGLTRSDWKDLIMEKFSLSKTHAYRIIKDLELENRVNVVTGKYFAKN